VTIARNFLVEIGPPPVRPDRAVLQIASYPAREDVLSVLAQLGRNGYSIALDDYDGDLAVDELLSLCAIVKVDVAGRSDDELERMLAGPRANRALLVAKGVADHEAFERCQAMGFSYFQGDFFAKPRVVTHRSVGTGGQASLRTLAELSAADASFEDLERIISSDVGLSLKLLRYVNSAFFALPRTIGSVREALTLLGNRTVRRWATVIAMSAMASAPHDLVALALHRGRMCEMLAGSALPEDREALFTIGLFSVVDGLTATPMEQVLEWLPFSDEIRAALLAHEGPKGALLATVLAYERGEFPELPQERAEEGLTLGGAYRASLEWAGEAERAVS
jgi:EAL and modified HD-GYP domain-containing signal transduction protein